MRGLLNKLKMFAIAAFAATAIGLGGLAAAPSASAMPAINCDDIYWKANFYFYMAVNANLVGDDYHYAYYMGISKTYDDIYMHYC